MCSKAGNPAASGVVLADDATGALECASVLAGLGFDVALTLDAEPQLCSGILVADTESRHLLAADAGRRIGRWPERTAAAIFKKTDSTLRGNIAAELLALLSRGPLVYVPAYPKLGRTVLDGRLLVNGIPVDQTEFARDALHPVRSSVVAHLFPAGSVVSIRDAKQLACFLALREAKIAICDAASDEDLRAIAESLRGNEVTVAGPSGFIGHWASLGTFPRKLPAVAPVVHKWLVVCGSRHPRSRRQAHLAERSGLTVLLSAQEELSPEAAATELARRAVKCIGECPRGPAGRPVLPLGVVVMGGDTAWALWRALGISHLTPLPEVLPGVAACLSGDLLFVTKAGGFGEDDLVTRVRERFV